MPKIKPHLKNLYRISDITESRKGYLRLDMNESVSGLPDDFIRQVLSAIDPESLAAYPEYNRLQEKIARYNNLMPDNICLSNGSDAAIKYIFDTYILPQDNVLITDPTFAMYKVYCEMFNAKVLMVEYNEDLSFPLEKFLSAISQDIKLAVVINPNNPTGTALDYGSLLTIIKRASDCDVLTIVDEAYFYFYPNSVIEEIKNYNNLIVLRTFSKLCSIASLRIGYAAASPQIIVDLKKVRPTYDINGTALLFAENIIDSPGIIKKLVEDTDEGKKYLAGRLNREAIDCKEGAANFILIKCHNRVNEVITRLREKNILINGNFKQDFLKDYIRVTVGNKGVMEKFWDSFIEIWNK